MLQTERTLVFRPSRQPTRVMPLTVRSAGHYLIGPNWLGEDTAPKSFFQVFWTLEGGGLFGVKGRTWRVGADELLLYRPGEPHRIMAEAPGWRYRWLTLDGPSTAAVLKSFGLGRRRWRGGPCPETLFETLHGALGNLTPFGELEASAIVYRILMQSATGDLRGTGESILARECRVILDREYGNARLSIDEVADRLRVHRTTLFRRFRESFGVSPADYLRNLRLRQAITALRVEDAPVAEIAARCGFSDANYFARQVRRATGRPPRELR